MSTTTSIAPTVAAALKTQIATALAGNGEDGNDVVVYDAMPLNFVQLDTVVIGDIVDGLHQYVTMRAGRKPRDERYTQHIWIAVVRAGSESTAARTAAFSHMSEIEDMIANDPKLGLSEPTLVVSSGGFQVNTTAEAELQGWRVTIRMELHVKVRLT